MKTCEIADLVSGELRGDGDVEITSVADITNAGTGQVAFFDKAETSPSTAASCVITSSSDAFTDLTTIIVKDPKLAFARVAAVLHPRKSRSAEVHHSAVISPTATIGKDVFVGAFVCVGKNSNVGDGTHLRAGAKIGDDVTVGSNCVLHANVVIDDGCSVGDNVVLHSGVVIGADGFGYVRDAEAGGEYLKFPQIGRVVIENDVEIGGNTCVDRGALGETRIGEGTKIDNLVQVGHNVQIGKRCVIAAQTGISGSVVIEDDCVIGGQVGFGDHVRVQSGAIIGSQAGVLPGKIVRPGVWWGTPIQPLDEYKRQNAHVKGLERLKAEIKELKSKLDGKGEGT
ncbi:MAG TPA: UDP-3-O-(3-hydroxymyristoyl)glucosamine N-acyltransferase [Pyrinomonadaceae bacterium]|nr:UDP-3-O-(3-hydroxymyristoyl)glucosamine N-acyltransferase [Pyrinomonadaceae bacterium]